MRGWHWQQRAFVLIMGMLAAFYQTIVAGFVAHEWKAGHVAMAVTVAALDIAVWAWFVLSMVLSGRRWNRLRALQWAAAGSPPDAAADEAFRAWKSKRIWVAVVVGGVLASLFSG